MHFSCHGSRPSRPSSPTVTPWGTHVVIQRVALHLIEFGYPERFVQEQVGHAYASTTAIYASVSNDFKTKTLQGALKRVYAPTEQEDQ